MWLEAPSIAVLPTGSVHAIGNKVQLEGLDIQQPTTDGDGTADANKLTNILGVQWDMATDRIFLALKGLHPASNPLTTKQVVL